MRRHHAGWILVTIWGVSIMCTASGQAPIPDSFPRFIVPGQDQAMQSLRTLFWLHYPGAGPKATLWDEWLVTPALWPAVTQDNQMQQFRDQWRQVLSDRIMAPDGYVATHQHASIAHQLGWPFPFWKQGNEHGWGWHFSLEGVPEGWHGTEERTQEGWTTVGVADEGIGQGAWNLELTAPLATVVTPEMDVEPLQAPFLQLRWRATGLGNAQPYIEWTTKDAAEFSPGRRMYFEPVESDTVVYTMIPVFEHPAWTGTITGLRLGFNNGAPGAKVGVQALFTQYDTRHNINNANFVRGCTHYFLWTRDLNFLRLNINRMRSAIRYVMTEFRAREENVVFTPWVGHDGRTGVVVDGQGNKTIRHGVGIGNNYWDLMPMGHSDAYATIQYYDALLAMARIEKAVLGHPEWSVPRGVLAFDPGDLVRHAADVKKKGNELFWNAATGRFSCGIDADGNSHDYGFTFLNLEAIYYDFATAEHAAAIMDWISGKRIVEGDTSTGADIYHWRFGPRATTKRNLGYYLWAWNSPESIPWGDQVQDGGAVLGFSYHDLIARLRVLGPDDVAARLTEIATWFDEVAAAGGYRAYYDGSRPGTMQGSGTPGGLGLDMEFFESVLVPQVMINGFLGLKPAADGLSLDPALPAGWPSLTVTRIRAHNRILDIKAAPVAIDVDVVDVLPVDLGSFTFYLPEGDWRVSVNGGPAEACANRQFTGAIEAGMALRFIK